MVINSLILTSTLLFGQISTSDLTEEQKAEIQMQVARMKSQNKNIDQSLPTADKLKQYAELGQSIGIAFSSTAKELGVAVDDFSKTNVGKLTITLIIWKIAGRDIAHFVGGTCFFLIMITLWTKYFKRLCLLEKLVYNENGKLKEKVYVKPTDEIHGTRFAMLVVLVGIIIASNIILFT